MRISHPAIKAATEVRFTAAAGGGGPVVFDAANGNNNGGSAASTLTISSFTVGAGSNKLLVVCYSAWDGTSTDARVTGVTWNGSEAFTKLEDTSGTISVSWTGAWILANPTSTTADIVLTFAGVTSESVAIAASVNSADQTIANHLYTKNAAGPTGNPPISYTRSTGIASGDYAVCVAYGETSDPPITDITPAGGTNEIVDQTFLSGEKVNWGGHDDVSSSSITLQGSVDLGVADNTFDWEGCMVCIKQAP